MRRLATTLVAVAVLGATLGLPASADVPQSWAMEVEQLGINPCTGEPLLLTMVVEFSQHEHQNNLVAGARLLVSTGDVDATMARFHLLENPNGSRSWLREIHVAPDGSKFKVTIAQTIRDGEDPEFSFDVRCIRGPSA